MIRMDHLMMALAMQRQLEHRAWAACARRVVEARRAGQGRRLDRRGRVALPRWQHTAADQHTAAVAGGVAHHGPETD